MMQSKTKTSLAISILSISLISGATAVAQSADALLDKLVEKGVLTVKEANDLREEADKDFKKAHSLKTGMPEWVNAFRINGDFRGRYEGHWADNPKFATRDRLRYRIRLGMTAILADQFEVGLRMASGDPVSGFGNNAGNPLSASSTMQDNGSRKFIYVDLAYAKWTPQFSSAFSTGLTFGKMENPFSFTHVVFDPDYNPEGLGGQFGYAVNDKHSLKLNAGMFVLDELSTSTKDPYLFGSQLTWEAKWNPQWESSIGGGILGITSRGSLSNGNVPNVNRGNTRTAAGAPAYAFTPIVGDASITYNLEKFPGYSGPFPIKVGGEVIHNPDAPANNDAFAAGITFGKGGKKGLWEISYQYRYIGADSWYEEFPDDDFGAFYQAQQPNAGFTGSGGGYGGGTNVRGHVVKAAYWPYDSLSIVLTYYQANLIHPVPSNSNSEATHVMVDLIWKF
jgi:hypothetical protein